MKIPNLETGSILIAAPESQGSEFHRTVIYLTSCHEKGVAGLVLNRPMKISLEQIFPEIKQTIPIFWGGPVGNDRLILLHNDPMQIPESTQVGDSIYWGGDFSVVKELLTAGKLTPDTVRFFIGYSGWGTGQLEEEIREKYWLTDQPRFDPLSARSENLWSECICGKSGTESLFFDPAAGESEYLS